jgi:hypothetical protein
MADRQVRSNGQLIAARQTPISSRGRAGGNAWHARRCRVLEQRTYLNLNLILIWQPLANETVTVRHAPNDVAAPYRKYGSFVLGNGVGGAGVHWNGQLWRAFRAR